MRLTPDAFTFNHKANPTSAFIGRMYIERNSRITTRNGAKLGDTEAKIKYLYPGQIKVNSVVIEKFKRLAYKHSQTKSLSLYK